MICAGHLLNESNVDRVTEAEEEFYMCPCRRAHVFRDPHAGPALLQPSGMFNGPFQGAEDGHKVVLKGN
jgi:hypothetical protein